MTALELLDEWKLQELRQLLSVCYHNSASDKPGSLRRFKTGLVLLNEVYDEAKAELQSEQP